VVAKRETHRLIPCLTPPVKSSSVKFLSLLVALSALGSVEMRAVVELQTLVDRSPFAPAGQASGTPTAPAEAATLEFRGLVVDASGASYSVFDMTAQKGKWLRAGDTEGPMRVKSYDEATNTLEVEQNGRAVKLELKRSLITAGQPGLAMAQQSPSNPGQIGANGGPAIGRGEGGPDARRLEAVAAEVRRRRALRNAVRPPNEAAPANTPAAPAAAAPK
jgi:hypothetical protein